MPYTYQQAAQAAIDVQDAVNLSGIVFSFADAMQAICDKSHEINEGTQWRNRHPIVRLFLLKLCNLNQASALPFVYEEALEQVQAIARE